MKRLLPFLLFLAIPVLSFADDTAFGWATAFSLTQGEGYRLTGGDPARTLVLQSNGFDMRDDVLKALKDYDVLVFDGSRGDFIISSSMQFRGLRGKTLLGVNGARIRTQFEVTPEIHQLLDSVGVNAMSDQGGGGPLSNGAMVGEEREQHVRQAIIDRYGDENERYRRSGLFVFSACENIVFRNLSLIGPGAIDVGGDDLLTLQTGCRHIWVDHCRFTDGMDGNFDIRPGVDFVTVSWCAFDYTDRSYGHQASNLIAGQHNPAGLEQILHITFAYCRWGQGVQVRMPVVTCADAHLLNNLYDCDGNDYPAVNPCFGARVLLEGNYFDRGVKNIFYAEPDALAWQFKGNIFKEKYSPRDHGNISVPYTYTVLPASRVPALVRAGAGPTLDLPVPEPTVDFTIHLMGD